MQFMMLGRLTQESLKAFVKNPIDRFKPAIQLVEAVVGREKESER